MAWALAAVVCLGILGGLALYLEGTLPRFGEPAETSTELAPAELAPLMFEPLPADITDWDDGLEIPLSEIDDYLRAID